jgi:cell division septal protein FtsQ
LSEDATRPLDLRPQVKGEGEGEGRRFGPRRWWPWAVAAAVGGLALAAAAAVSPVLDVDDVVVRGLSGRRAAQVRDAAGVRTGEAMVAVDGGAAASSVEELPWVRSATVRRSWPGRVVVEVQERTPVAALAGGGRWVLVDGDGRRLARVRQPPAGVVAVEGVDALGQSGTRVDRLAAGAVELSRRLPPAVRFRLPRVQVDPDGRLDLMLRIEDERDAVAAFGRPEQLRDKVLSLATVLESVDLRGLSRIDLRIPGAPVLTRIPTAP